MLEIAILGLLMDRDHHGYEIRAQLRDRLGFATAVSFGSIYPALARLERHGLIEVVTVVPAKLSALSTGSLSGERASLRTLRQNDGLGRRGRKVYHLTAKGREEFLDQLADTTTIDDAKDFALRVALARHLDGERRRRIFERRRLALQERLSELATLSKNEALDRYARSVLAQAARGGQLELEWIDELLEQDRTTQETFAREAK